MPCPAGSFYAGFNATQKSDCLQCRPDNFSPSGASLCTRCSDGQTSKAGAATCDVVSCVPSAFDADKFKCFSDLAKAAIIIGYIVSLFSSIFSVYKARVFVRERVQRLQAAGVEPTLKRIVFVERTLADHSKHMLRSHADKGAAPDEGGTGSEDAVVQMVRGNQRQLQEQQQQFQEQQRDIQQLQEQLKQQQEQIQQLTHHIQRLQQV
jgi:hypothetical protein